MTQPSTSSKRICLVAVNFAPEVTGCGPYTTDLARALAEAGHTVEVITGFPHYPSWRIDDQYLRLRSHTYVEDRISIRRLRHFVPRKMNVFTRILFELSFLSKILSLGSIKADIVVAVSPAFSDVIGAAMIRQPTSRFLVLVQDLLSIGALQSSLTRSGLVSQVLWRIERRFLLSADSIGIVSDKFIHEMQRMGINSNKIRITRNYQQAEVKAENTLVARQAHGFAANRFIILHTGNMGYKQHLSNVIEAAAILENQDCSIQFILVGDGTQRDALEMSAKRLSNVEFKPLVEESKYSLLLGAADLLLINESPTQLEMSLPSKLTSYLAAERRIVAAVPLEGATAEFLRENVESYSLVKPDNPEELAKVILELKAAKNAPPSRLLSPASDLRLARVEWVLDV